MPFSPVGGGGGGSSEWNAGTVDGIGPGLTIGAFGPNVISANWQATEGPIFSLSGLNYDAGELASDFNVGSVGALAGLSIEAGTLISEWQASTVTAIGNGLTINAENTLIASTVLFSDGKNNTVTTAGDGLTITSGTLIATGGTGASEWQAGTVTALGAGLAITGETLAATGATGVTSLIYTPYAGEPIEQGGTGSSINFSDMMRINNTIEAVAIAAPILNISNGGTYYGFIAPINSGGTLTGSPNFTEDFISSSTVNSPGATLTMLFSPEITLSPGTYAVGYGSTNGSVGNYFTNSGYNNTAPGFGPGATTFYQHSSPIVNGSTPTSTSGDLVLLSLVYQFPGL